MYSGYSYLYSYYKTEKLSHYKNTPQRYVYVSIMILKLLSMFIISNKYEEIYKSI